MLIFNSSLFPNAMNDIISMVSVPVFVSMDNYKAVVF